MHRLILALPVLAVLYMSATSAEPAERKDVETIKSCLTASADEPRRCIGPVSDACQTSEGGGQSTLGIGTCLGRETAGWDAILNEKYAEALASAKEMDAMRKADGDTEATAATDLVKAQRAWIAYRDAECARIYELNKDGSIRTIEAAACTRDLTAERAIALMADDG